MFLVHNDQYEAEKMEDDDFEGDGAEHGLRDNVVGDVEAYCLEEDMNHELPFCEAEIIDHRCVVILALRKG
jgi:hypothetical protein